MEKDINDKTPTVNIGDLVVMRAKDLKLKKFGNYIPDDLGLVVELFQSTSYHKKWYAMVAWQQFKSGSPQKLLAYRLKKAYK